ncbi:hypothetical protein B0H10DRAFT_2207122 [Mycena sp. CBHHK59/15]|nr:hypothetical protein B0H10DRAFT_2207122 [Mycena sp. CBHHK59/15]
MGEAITLHFPEFVRVAGEVLQGHVDLNVALAKEDKIEKLYIKFRGSIVTKITETKREDNKTSTENHTQTVQLLRYDQTLWDQWNAPASLDSQVITCPFQLQLPPTLPPSFHYSGFHRTVAVSYSLEVVGDRAGLFHSNRRIRRMFSVVPGASAWELSANAALKQGWGGAWRSYAADEKLRHGIWGDYSHASVELVLPDIPSLPMVTPIPFSLHVVTHTKPVHRSDLEDKHGKLFPAPPADPAKVKLVLYRKGRMRVHHRSEPIEEKFDLAGSLGDAKVRTRADEPEWAHSEGHKEDKGVWKRAVHFDALLSLPFAPSFAAETVEWNYSLRIEVPFPGIGNDLELEVPLRIDSGCACPPPPPPIGAPNANTNYANYPLPAGPPPMLTLPPAYWKGDDHDWDE